MNKFFSHPYVRLAGRALVAGLVSALVQLHTESDGSLAWHAAVVAGALAFVEVFTPLNSLVGFFKKASA
jgi:hypothetical protein